MVEILDKLITMATKNKNKRSLEYGYDMYNPAPFIENNPSFKYYADNINPIYVDNNTGEVWQNNKPKGSIILPDIEVKGRHLKATEAGRNMRQEKGLELTYPELELLPLANIIGTPIKNLANNVIFNSVKGYNNVIDDVMKAAYYNAKFAEKPGTISKINTMKFIYSSNPPKVKTNPLNYIKDKKSLLSSEAYYSPSKNEIVINPLTLLYNHDRYKGIIAHEATHAFKDFNPLRLSVWDKGPYYIPNPELGTVLKPFNRAASKGKWEGSPEELRAEMYNWKYRLDDLFTPYKKSKNKKRYIKEAMNRFYLNKYETARTLDALSNLGYF